MTEVNMEEMWVVFMRLIRQKCETSEYFICWPTKGSTHGYIQPVCLKISSFCRKGLARKKKSKSGLLLCIKGDPCQVLISPQPTQLSLDNDLLMLTSP